LLVIASGGGWVLTSTDGATWEPRTTPLNNQLAGIVWADTMFIATGAGGGAGGVLVTSTNGIDWTEGNVGNTCMLGDIAYSGSNIVIISGDVACNSAWTSEDGITWTVRTIPFAGLESIHGVTWTGTQYVIVGANGKIVVSPDGDVWSTTVPYTGPDSTLYEVAWSGELLVAVGIDGRLITSADGAAWTERTSGLTHSLHGVAWSGDMFVAVGDSGKIITSEK
jgi:hypothetical protein